MTKQKIIIGVAAVLVLAVVVFFLFNRGNEVPKFKTDKVSKGNLQAAITATGTVNPVTSVLVGTQVSGTIQKLFVDFNSVVNKSQILAQIDPALFQAKVDQARAALATARANVDKAAATLADARRTRDRNKTLLAKNFISQSDLDTAETNYLSAEAQLSAAKAQVEQARADLNTAEINLRYTRILSPVNGIVISRNVDVGQTVAASFQTPTLFTIAQDMTKMQIDTSVDEADIGRAGENQAVDFTVDAYPDMVFKGKVSEVRNAPTTVQNVVTYDVVVLVDNKDHRLKPGMTANVSIVTATKNDVLRVPNAALRVRHQDRAPAKPPQKAAGAGVWVRVKGEPQRVSIKTGISDGNFTEVLSGDLKEGDEVIVEAASAAKKENKPPTPGFIR